MAKLTELELTQALGQVPGWIRAGQNITRMSNFKDFPDAMRFVNRVAELAEAADHHPDIDIRGNKVLLALSTHSEHGLTQKDFDLARKISTAQGGK